MLCRVDEISTIASFVLAAVAVIVAVLIGFGATFYVKPLFKNPPIARSIICVHGFVMATWVILFPVQVYFISSKKIMLLLGNLVADGRSSR